MCESNTLLGWSLKNKEQGKKIIGYWDVNKNAKLNLFIYNEQANSNKKAWFKCPTCGKLLLKSFNEVKVEWNCNYCNKK